MATVTDPLIASIPLHPYKRLVLFRVAKGRFTAISSLTTWRVVMPQLSQLSLCCNSEHHPLHLQVPWLMVNSVMARWPPRTNHPGFRLKRRRLCVGQFFISGDLESSFTETTRGNSPWGLSPTHNWPNGNKDLPQRISIKGRGLWCGHGCDVGKLGGYRGHCQRVRNGPCGFRPPPAQTQRELKRGTQTPAGHMHTLMFCLPGFGRFRHYT